MRRGNRKAVKPPRFFMEGNTSPTKQKHRRNDLDSMVSDFLRERVPEFVQLEAVRNEVGAKT